MTGRILHKKKETSRLEQDMNHLGRHNMNVRFQSGEPVAWIMSLTTTTYYVKQKAQTAAGWLFDPVS